MQSWRSGDRQRLRDPVKLNSLTTHNFNSFFLNSISEYLRAALKSISNTQSAPASFKIIIANKIKRRLPIKTKV